MAGGPHPESSVDWASARVVLTGGAGFLGRHVVAQLNARGVPDEHIFIPRRREFDLTREADCARLYSEAFAGDAPSMVIHLAAEVGGIGANRDNPGRYFFANMAMALHLIEQFRAGGLIDRGGRFVQVGTICAPTPSTRPCRSARRSSGTATPRRRTPRTASPRRPRGRCSTPTRCSTAWSRRTCCR